MILVAASIADTARSLGDEVAQFFDDLSQVHLGYLAAALAVFFVYLLARSRATFNALRAAYPDERFSWRKIWGAYVAAYGLNGVVPAGGGSVVQLVLSRNAIPNSTYPTVSVALCVVLIFDTIAGAGIMAYAFTQGIFPKPADFASLDSFDISFFASHTGFTLFLVTLTVLFGLTAYAVLSTRVAAFREHLRQGMRILSDRRRYLLGMVVPQSLAWILRGGAYWLLLDAFRIGGSLRYAVLILAVQILAAIVPFTPGGAGVQQAILVAVFGGVASGNRVAAFSVGQQIAIVAFTLTLAFGAIVFIFRYRSFRAVLRDTRDRHAAETAAEREPVAG